jgi:transposase
MARVVEHLSVADLEAGYEACEDVTSSRHFQTIFLLAKGHSTKEVAAITSFGQRWVEQLLERYNAFGPSTLGDLRRENGSDATVLKPELLMRLRVRLEEPPPDGGRWTSGKVARWMALDLGLEKLAPQRGWEALKAIGWSIQKPRPRNPKAATQTEQEAFKKKSPRSAPKKPRPIQASRSKPSRPMNTGSA